ncbi:MAG: trypsin-like peptidase domain-containing protein [Phycisphaerales bacterium JB054]
MPVSRGWLRRGLLASAVWLMACGPGEAAQSQARVLREKATNERSTLDATGRAAPVDTLAAVRLSSAFRGAADRALPAVVSVRTVTTQRVVRGQPRIFRFFPDMPGLPDDLQEYDAPSAGSGSGFVFAEQGYILTNRHVVDGADEVAVTLADGREYDAEIIGTDAMTDVAVIKIEPAGDDPLPVARFGDSDRLQVGDWVLALGNPLGLDFTVTAGIVSAKGRNVGILNRESGNAAVEAFIQTDAAINPGNSGGALINLDGEVVGINSAIFSRTGGSVGLGFSIPIELASAVYTNIVNDGRVDFGWLGVEIDSSGDAVRVARVLEDSPAENAGLRSGDQVLRYQGRPVTSGSQLIRSIQFTPPGSDAALDVIRDGRPVELRAQIVSRTEAEVERFGGQEIVSLGVVVMTATPESLGTGTGTGGLGVYILDITPNGLAARAGLARGDMIVAVNREPVRTVDALVAELGRAGRAVRIDLQRGEVRGYTTLRR